MFSLANLNSVNSLATAEAARFWYESPTLALNNVLPSLIHQYGNNRYYDTAVGQTPFPFSAVRAGNATQFDSQGRLVWAPANMIPQSSTAGAVLGIVGSGGAFPTGWFRSTATGITHEILAIASDYIDVRISGTNGTGSTVYPQISPLQTPLSAVVGESYTGSMTMSIIGGSTANFSTAVARLNMQWLASGSYINEAPQSAQATSVPTRLASQGPVLPGANQLRLSINLSIPIGQTVDITIRIGLPQVERTSVNSPQPYIETTGAAKYCARRDYDPAINLSYSYGPELITDPTCVTPAAWTTTAWTVSGGQLVATAVSNTGIEQTNVSFVDGQLYLVEFDYNFSAGNMTVYRGQGVQVISSGVTGVGRFSQIFRANGGATKLLFQAAVASTTCTIDNVSVRLATPTCSPTGLLIEESRVNSVVNSAMVGGLAPSTAPTGWNITAVAGITTTYAYGTESGIPYIDVTWAGTNTSGANAFPTVFLGTTSGTVAAANGQKWAASVYVRQIAGATNITTFSHNVRGRASGALVSGQNDSAPLADATGIVVGRTSRSFTFTDASITHVEHVISTSLIADQACNITIRIGGPQLELGALPTSLIPTFGVAATRTVELISKTPTAWFNPENVIYIEYESYALAGSSPMAFSLDDNTTLERIYLTGSTTQQGSANSVAGVEVGVVSVSVPNLRGTFRKVARRNQTNNHTITANGTLGGIDVSGATTTAVTHLRIGGSASGAVSAILNGHVKEFRVYSNPLASNAQMQALTA